MVIYNITIKVDWSIHNHFKSWIEEEVLESAKEISTVNSSKFLKLLDVDSSDGMTYCVQHYFDNLGDYNMYKMAEDIVFKNELADRYKDKLVLFTSVLSEV